MVLATWLAAFVAPILAAPPELNFFYPAGGQQGKTVKVKADGTFATWPPLVWIDRPGIKVEAVEEKNTLTFEIGDDASPGLYWIRFHDAEGATVPRPFLVGTLPEVTEAEPNDDPTKPQALPSSQVIVNGQLSKSGDVDTFAVKLTAGQTLIATIEANRWLKSPMDAVLQITDRDGIVLQQNDDARGLDPQLVFEAPRDGTFLVRTFAFPATPNSTIGFAGAENFIYRLTITTGGYVDHAMPMNVSKVEPTTLRAVGWNLPESSVTTTKVSDTEVQVAFTGATETVRLESVDVAIVEERQQDGPQPIELPAMISGTISADREVDAFVFPTTKGQKLTLRLESKSLGFPLDAVLQIVDSSGKLLKEVDDVKKQQDPEVAFTAIADGELTVRVFDLHGRGGLRFAYRLLVQETQPDFEVSLQTATLTIQPGKQLKVALGIERKNGFDEEIEFDIKGPKGVTAAAVKSLNEGESAKGVELVLTASEDATSGPIEIIGQAVKTPSRQRIAGLAGEDDLVLRHLIWLSVVRQR